MTALSFYPRFRRCGLALAAAITLLLPATSRAQVIVNEILAANGNTTAPLAELPDYFPEYIELYNAGTTDIDLGAEGWTITDNALITNRYQFPVGTILYADSFMLLFCDSETNFPGIHVGFSLDGKTGETISMYRRSGANYVRVLQTTFGIQLSGYSVGRVPGANSNAELTLNFPTPCGGTVPCLANVAAPFLPPPVSSNAFTLKINEWLATNSAGADEDWLELYNPDPTNIVALDFLVLWDKAETLFTPPQPTGTSGPRPIPPLSYIGPLGYVQLFCSGDLRPDADNLNFGISSGSDPNDRPPDGVLDTVTLHAPIPNRATVLDVVKARLRGGRNVSEGRVPDGSSRFGIFPNPTPGEANFGPIPEININELLSHTDPPLQDAVEFQNVSTNAVDMSYWWLSNARNNPKKYQFPSNTIVQPGAFLVVYEKDFNTNALGNDRGFTFNSSQGDQCYIFKADSSGELLGFRKGVDFGAAPNGYSFGRYTNSVGDPDFVLQSDLSLGTAVRAGMPEGFSNIFRTGLGATNAPVLLSPVTINEIHFHPAGKLGLTDTNDNSDDEFIELRNHSSQRVNLFYELRFQGENPLNQYNPWRLRGIVDFDFPSNSFPFMAPNSYLLFVNFDPRTNDLYTAQWLARMGVSPSAQVFGPYRGKLSNREGSVELYRPDTPQAQPHPDAGFVPQILVDRVHYQDRPPWPSNSVDNTVWADGGFGSVQRRFSYEYGNEPTNWFVAGPTPGYFNSANHLELPYFLVSPSNFIDVPPRTNVQLFAVARGETPITYQWYRNGAPIPGQNRTNLPIPNVGAANIGQYYAVASNPAGSSTSITVTVSVACPYLLSRVSASFGQPGGEGSVTVMAAAGCPWEVTGIPPWVTAVTPAMVFDGTDTFVFTVAPHTGTTVRKVTLMVAGQPFEIKQSPADNTPPKVAFVAPASGARVTTQVATIRGTASDNFDIQRVEVQTGSGAFIPALGTKSWTNVTTLQPGTNWIRVRSVDLSGNISATSTRSVFYVVPSPLNLAIKESNSWGTVSGATNQQRLEIGRGYTLTATPRPGFVFSNWTGDIPTSGNPKLQFLMAPNMSLTANYVPNPFIPTKGAYNGLFSAFGALYHTNAGSFKITTTDKGTYSASVSVGGKRYSASGKLDLFGMATNVIPRTGLTPLKVEWILTLNTNEAYVGTVNGVVAAADWAAPAALFGAWSVFNATTRPAPFAGKYTLSIAGVLDQDVPIYPRGAGYGTVTISTSGSLTFAGVLADGTRVTQSVAVDRFRAWPLHALAYSGRGSIMDWVSFDTNFFLSDMEGFVTWVRPSGPTPKYYTDGFIMERTVLTGSLYKPPVGATNRILNLTEAQIVLDGGNLLNSPSINNVLLGLSSKVTNASPNTLTCTFTLSSGLFSGTFREAGSTRTITYRGAVLQKGTQNRGLGHFLGTNECGHVSFEARPTPP